MKLTIIVCGIVASVFFSTAKAVDNAIAPACSAAEHRQFDFWLGEWTVTMPNGNKAGDSSITREINGCVLHEHYQGQKGYYGESFNIYDASRQQWHQSWVDNGATLLLLDGGVQNGVMVLLGIGKDPQGKEVKNRISWSQNNDGTVRQLWESSRDDGKTWQVQFDGKYSKKK